MVRCGPRVRGGGTGSIGSCPNVVNPHTPLHLHPAPQSTRLARKNVHAISAPSTVHKMTALKLVAWNAL